MNHINRLLRKARRAKNGNGMYVIGFVEYDHAKNVFTASGRVWDGKPGTDGETFYSEHNTLDEAIAACEAVEAQYPKAENVNFIIDDMTLQEGD